MGVKGSEFRNRIITYKELVKARKVFEYLVTSTINNH